MSTFDVRGDNVAYIDIIVFADPSSYDFYAEQLEKESTGFRITETDDAKYIKIKDREHADNLIKAIEKAKQLGWI